MGDGIRIVIEYCRIIYDFICGLVGSSALFNFIMLLATLVIPLVILIIDRGSDEQSERKLIRIERNIAIQKVARLNKLIVCFCLAGIFAMLYVDETGDSFRLELWDFVLKVGYLWCVVLILQVIWDMYRWVSGDWTDSESNYKAEMLLVYFRSQDELSYYDWQGAFESQQLSGRVKAKLLDCLFDKLKNESRVNTYTYHKLIIENLEHFNFGYEYTIKSLAFAVSDKDARFLGELIDFLVDKNDAPSIARIYVFLNDHIKDEADEASAQKMINVAYFEQIGRRLSLEQYEWAELIASSFPEEWQAENVLYEDESTPLAVFVARKIIAWVERYRASGLNQRGPMFNILRSLFGDLEKRLDSVMLRDLLRLYGNNQSMLVVGINDKDYADLEDMILANFMQADDLLWLAWLAGDGRDEKYIKFTVKFVSLAYPAVKDIEHLEKMQAKVRTRMKDKKYKEYREKIAPLVDLYQELIDIANKEALDNKDT